jgi:glycosyltransferase involved in cell wall biosynthesis
MTDTSLGIIIPAYKPERHALTECITEIQQQLQPAVIRVEIDTPQEDLLSALESTPAEINAVPRRRGKGGAIMDGFDSLQTDLLAFVDADGSVPASSLVDIVRQVRMGRADLSVGSRRHPAAEIVSHQTVIRRLLGDIFAYTARQLLPTQCYDYQCGAKAVRADAWAEIRHYCYEQGFAWDLELLSVADSLGYEIHEVPVRWEDHPQSTVDPLGTTVELGTALLSIRRRTGMIPRRTRKQPTKSRYLTTDGD